jgi:hypothetical protein
VALFPQAQAAMTAQAQRAFEAYRAALGRSPRHTGLCPWDHLPRDIREAWQEAVAAAVRDVFGYTEPDPETLVEKKARLVEQMKTAKLAPLLKELLPGRAFILLSADFGKARSLEYVSNVDRGDAVQLLREWLGHHGAL